MIDRLTEQLEVVVQATGDEPPRVADLIKQIQEATISLEHGHSCAELGIIHRQVQAPWSTTNYVLLVMV